MTNVAKAYRNQEAFLEAAVVVSVSERAIAVAAAGEHLQAERAAMCLLAPEAGDRVLIATLPDRCFVLGVLERDADAEISLDVDGDISLRSRSGQVRIAAKHGLELGTAGEAAIVAKAFALRTVHAKLLADKLELLGGQVEAKLERVGVVAKEVHSRLKQSFRFVEQLDQLWAKHIDRRASELSRTHGRENVVTADHLVKMDGEQVHVG